MQAATVYRHLAYFLEQGQLVLADVIELPAREISLIEDAIISLPDDQKNALKPVFEAFSGQYSYDILRCVRAALQHQTA